MHEQALARYRRLSSPLSLARFDAQRRALRYLWRRAVWPGADVLHTPRPRVG